MPFSPTRHRVALVLALVGVALGLFIEFAHQNPSTPWVSAICRSDGLVNCDAVIGSRYGRFLGVPVAMWGILAFAAGALLTLPGALGRPAKVADLGIVALASWNLGFAIVLAVLMLGVIRHVCVFCLTM